MRATRFPMNGNWLWLPVHGRQNLQGWESNSMWDVFLELDAGIALNSDEKNVSYKFAPDQKLVGRTDWVH